MTGPEPAVPAGQPACDDLTARVFRALYPQFDLYHADGAYLAVPKGAPCFAGPSLGAIARQISDHEHTRQLPPGPWMRPPEQMIGPIPSEETDAIAGPLPARHRARQPRPHR